jgi:DNA modification methylase
MKIIKVNINELKVSEYNPRLNLKPEDKEFKAIQKSIESFGLVEPIIVNNDMTVIGGHQRLKVCKHLNQKTIDCCILNIDKQQEKQLNLALNKIAGKWDEKKLFNILNELDQEDFLLTGFTEDEFANLENQFKDINTIEDNENSSNHNQDQLQKNESQNIKDDTLNHEEVEESYKNPISKIGDIYILGTHILMCGDSTNQENIEKLISKFNKDMDDILIFMDPPYGINIVGSDNKIGGSNTIAKCKTYEKIIGDESTDSAKNNYKVISKLGFKKFIIFGGHYFLDFLDYPFSWIIWDKRGGMNSNHFGDGEIALSSLGHPIRIFKHIWNGMIQEGTREERHHPTQKPIQLIYNILNMFYEKNQFKYVIDFFGGSGSTMLACEKLGIDSATMEFSPAYCDVIIRRYIKLKGGIDNLFLVDGNKFLKLCEIDKFKDLLIC